MPVTVDYREKYYATGRFPGGFTKREGKATDEEILISRLVDRALRPLFPSDYHCEVFVQIWLLSSDGKDQPDALAGFAASAAMACSTIPFEHTISECRVARINGEYVIDPTFEQMKDADLDIMVGCTKDNLMMVEGEMSEVSEQGLIERQGARHRCQARVQRRDQRRGSPQADSRRALSARLRYHPQDAAEAGAQRCLRPDPGRLPREVRRCSH